MSLHGVMPRTPLLAYLSPNPTSTASGPETNTITDSNYHYSPHSHKGLTTHLVVGGQLTLWYPNEEDREKRTFGPGERIDVDAGRVHEVWIGEEGCTYVIGE